MTVLWKQKQDSKHNNCFPRTPSHWYWDSVWGRTEQFRVDKILSTKLHWVLYFVRRDKSSVTRSKSGKHLTHSNSEHSIKSNTGDSLWFSSNCDSPEGYVHFKGSLTQNKPSQNWVTRSWMLLRHLFSEQKTHCTTQSSRGWGTGEYRATDHSFSVQNQKTTAAHPIELLFHLLFNTLAWSFSRTAVLDQRDLCFEG